MPLLSRAAFDATFHPRPAPSGDPLWSWAEVQNQPAAHVWSIVTGDDDESEYASPGYHVVNRIGYVVTVHPWVNEAQDAEWDAMPDGGTR